jgi:hypothetical protein
MLSGRKYFALARSWPCVRIIALHATGIGATEVAKMAGIAGSIYMNI